IQNFPCLCGVGRKPEWMGLSGTSPLYCQKEAGGWGVGGGWDVVGEGWSLVE
ncbi:hypothetical protein Tco_0585249, partial [Tanacetum coccineum]